MKRKIIPVIEYPTGLVTPDTDYMHIQVIKYTPVGTSTGQNNFQFNTGNRVNQPNVNNIEGDIFLPIPLNVSDSTTVTWKNSELNPIAADAIEQAGGFIEDLGYNNIKDGTAAGKAAGRFDEIVKKYGGALKDAGLQDGIEAFLLGKAVNVAGANVDVNDLITRRSGQVINPNLELLFKSVNLRRFNYTFQLTPRSREESNNIKGIIRTFKKRMAAKSTTNGGTSKGLFISSPDVFKLTFMSGASKHPFLHEHKICALTNLQVNYTATGTYATYEDATPVQVNMSLEFTEISPIYQEDYPDNPGADAGVGF